MRTTHQLRATTRFWQPGAPLDFQLATSSLEAIPTQGSRAAWKGQQEALAKPRGAGGGW